MEHYEVSRQTRSIPTGLETEIWPIGDHGFDFEFYLPQNSAPTDKSKYGSTCYALEATASRDGRKPISANCELYIVANPSKEGSAVPGYNVIREVLHDVLGPMRIRLASRYLLINGYVSIDVHFASVQRDVHIDAIRIGLEQDYQLTNLSDEDGKVCHVRETFPLWSTGRSTGVLAKLDKGKDFALSHQFQLAMPQDGEAIRPSTLPSSITGLRNTHTFLVILDYTIIDEQGRASTPSVQYQIAAPAIIASKWCQNAFLQLPVYCEQDDVETKARAAEKMVERICLERNFLTKFDEAEYGLGNLQITSVPQATLAQTTDKSPTVSP